MLKRHPNNSGTVTKLAGNRANPYLARLPAREKWNPDKKKTEIYRESLGTYRTESEAWKAIAKYREANPEKFDRTQKNSLMYAHDITVGELYEKWTGSISFREKSSSTQSNYTSVWNKYLHQIGKLPITQVKTSNLSVLINNIDAKSGTKKNALTVMRQLFKMAISDDIIDKNYADFVDYEVDDTEIVRNCFTAEEIKKLHDSNHWLAHILLIELYSGARIKEIINLKAEDVHIEGEEIPYFHIREGKNKFAVRDVPIHSAILELFKSLMVNCTTYIINDAYGRNIEPRRVQEYASEIETIVGSQHYIYDAKHTFVTQCAVCGVDKLHKINIIGHTPAGTSEKVYTHLKLESLKAEIEKVKY